ncbi:hypothetical protein D3C75_1317200 [compost metagenome]
MKRSAYFKRNGPFAANFLDALCGFFNTRLGTGDHNLSGTVDIGQLNGIACFRY